MRILTAVALGLAALASPAAQQPARGPAGADRAPSARADTRREVPVPFRVGETLTYDVAGSTYLIAGTASTTVVEKTRSDNSNAYYIVAEGRPLPLIARLYALYYKMDTLVDSFTALSQRSSLYIEEGPDHQTATTRFDRPARRALVELRGDTVLRDTLAVPPDAQDGLATLYALRTRTFRAGNFLPHLARFAPKRSVAMSVAIRHSGVSCWQTLQRPAAAINTAPASSLVWQALRWSSTRSTSSCPISKNA
jgi:hypothetical protein